MNAESNPSVPDPTQLSEAYLALCAEEYCRRVKNKGTSLEQNIEFYRKHIALDEETLKQLVDKRQVLLNQLSATVEGMQSLRLAFDALDEACSEFNVY